jgi:hypothetical protein
MKTLLSYFWLAVLFAWGLTVAARATISDEWVWRNPLPTGNTIRSVIAANYSFVAVGNAGTILTSADGSTWTGQVPVTNATLSGVTYGSGNYVAVGDHGTILISHDSSCWAAVETHFTRGLYGVFGDSQGYIAVGAAGTILTSRDGLTWTNRFSGTPYDLFAIAQDQGAGYIAVGAAGTILTS